MNAKQPLNQQGREAYSGQIKNFSKERYISSDWYTREWRTVWAKSWIATVHVSDLSEPGDYVVFDLGPGPSQRPHNHPALKDPTRARWRSSFWPTRCAIRGYTSRC